MTAKRLIGETSSGKRIPLTELVPLHTPLLLQIFPIYACNFKCYYCPMSVAKDDRHFISNKIVMPFDLFKKCIDDATKFQDKIKVIRFVGMGEPLLHNRLSEMIRYTKEKNVAENIEILTNASLLTPKLSNELIDAGLSKLIISLQGITKEGYFKVSEVNIDFGLFLDNIKYFFEHKKSCHLHIKIIDCALSKEDEENFYNLFENMCDTIAIEYMGPIYKDVTYNIDKLNTTQYGIPYSIIEICSQPFFVMQINPDGNVVPCYSIEYPIILGNCNEESIFDIWTNKVFNKFRYDMLDGINTVCKICKDCKITKHRAWPSDNLNNDIKQLKKFYKS